MTGKVPSVPPSVSDVELCRRRRCCNTHLVKGVQTIANRPEKKTSCIVVGVRISVYKVLHKVHTSST